MTQTSLKKMMFEGFLFFFSAINDLITLISLPTTNFSNSLIRIPVIQNCNDKIRNAFG